MAASLGAVDAGQEKDTERVSVVVPTRNSEATLEACLTSIRAQTHRDVELIVVDNNSQDSTPEIGRRYADVFEQLGPERSAQRNHGAQLAGGRYLLMVDSDMVLDERVAEECVERARAEGAEAIVIPERSIGKGFWAACKALERSCYVGDDTIEAARFFTREAYQRHGGYDEDMIGPEDWDLPARLRLHGSIGRIDAEIIHVEGHLRLRDTVSKKFYYGQHLGSYLRRHPELARRQLVLIRPAFVRHRRRLAQRPLVTAGMVVMKTAEFAAGALGLALSRLRKA
jgi:glycosyltransferase involved in cell wall biosynthesis